MDIITPKFELFTDHDSLIDDKPNDNNDWNINRIARPFDDLNNQRTIITDDTVDVKKKYKKKRQQCPECPMSYSKREYLSKHMQNEHKIELEKKKPGRQSAFRVSGNDARPYKCDQCVKEYARSKHLARHRRTHIKKRCNDCDEVFDNYVEHMLKRHGIELPRPFQCDICKKSYRTKTNIQSHMRIHRTESRVHKCSVCPKTFCFGTDLRKHIQTHSQNRSIICDICGDAFKSTDTLKCHLRRHTGERPYKCTLCPRAFSTSNSLDIHFRTHTGERPFACEFCFKKFSDSSTLLVHKRLHTNENPYICHLCGRRTKQASNLRSHYKHFHKNNDITGRQIRSNSRIFNRFTQADIDAQLQETGDLMALLERGLVEFDREEREKSMQIEERLRDTIINSHQVKTQNSTEAENDFKIDPASVEKLEIEVDAKGEIETVQPAAFSLPAPLPPVMLPTRNSPVAKCETLNPEIDYLESMKDVQPKIESVFLEDNEFQPPDMIHFSTVDIKDEQYYEDSMQESLKILQVESVVMDEDEKPYKIEPTFNDPDEIKENWIKRDEQSIDTSESDDGIPEETQQTQLKPPQRIEMKQCVLCKKKFHDLSKHWIQIHSGMERPFECFVCHRNYKRYEHIKYHMKIHGDERNYICHVCGEAFFLSNELRKHIMNRHQVERPYKCTFQQGKKCFKNRHALNIHMRTHLGIKPHVCGVCSESFAALSSLKIHERKHTGDKPYVCKFCQKAFADCSTHKQHVRTTTG